MSSGAQWQAEVRKALADLHKAQRNRRGKRPQGIKRPEYGRLGYRREPPSNCECEGTCECTPEGQPGGCAGP